MEIIENKLMEERNNIPMTQERSGGGFEIAQEGFGQMYERNLPLFKLGQIIEGKIARVDEQDIFVDIGSKTEGKIARVDFKDVLPQVGHTVQVMVMKLEDEDGNITISKTEVDKHLARKEIKKALLEGHPIQGKILKGVKGGFLVDVGTLEAFLPGSQLDIKKVTNNQDYIGRVFDFKVEKYDHFTDNLVITRKAYLKEEQTRKKEKFFSQAKEGDIIRGEVKNVMTYGGFIGLSDVLDGFVHIKDLSWDMIQSSHVILTVGSVLDFKILKLNKEEGRVNLGLKQVQEDPWKLFVKNHKVGEVLEGEVKRYSDYGAFVRVDVGIEGMVHLNELSWTQKVRHPREVLRIGDIINSAIIAIDPENRKLSLSLKQVITNPWEEMKDYKPGRRLKGKVKNVLPFGVFVSLENGLTGLLHISQIDWLEKNPDLKKSFWKGKEIDVVILDVKEKEKMLSLGLKQLFKNPWDDFYVNHPSGSMIQGKVKTVLDNGLIVELQKGLEGFLHQAELSNKKRQVGDLVKALIKRVDVRTSKIWLSERSYEALEEKKVLMEYSQKEKEDQICLGDLLSLKDLTKNISKKGPKKDGR